MSVCVCVHMYVMLVLLASPKSMHMEEHTCMLTQIIIIECVWLVSPHTWGHDSLCEPRPGDGGDGVAEDVVLAALDGQGVGKPQQAQLGGAVVGLPKVAVDARRRGRHDDSGRRRARETANIHNLTGRKSFFFSWRDSI